MFHWDPNPEIVRLPIVDWPILWYGVLFALGFAVGFPLFVSILRRFFLNQPGYTESDNKKAVAIADRMIVYVVVATVVGARLGHFFFYEKPSDYFRDPWEIFRVWEGGLASHGAAIGIILALGLFSYRIRKIAKGLSWIRLLDFVSVPAAFAGCCIRIGNFFNQEILGTPTTLPWAVIFGHPADRSSPAPRHPVQLYEAAFYLLVFLLLWRLSMRPKFLMARGKLFGLFLILVFGFRFFVEFLKVEQSNLLSEAPFLTMGQILSLPAVLAGLLFFFWKRKI